MKVQKNSAINFGEEIKHKILIINIVSNFWINLFLKFPLLIGKQLPYLHKTLDSQ